MPFRPHLDALGLNLVALGRLLGPTWALLVASWAQLGRSWALLGRSWVALGPLLGRSWALLDTPGPPLADLGSIFNSPRLILIPPGIDFRPSEDHLGTELETTCEWFVLT